MPPSLPIRNDPKFEVRVDSSTYSPAKAREQTMKKHVGMVLLTCVAVTVWLAGCDRRAEETRTGRDSDSLKPAAAHAPVETGPALKFTAPAGWISETPTSSMRKAQYRLPRVAGDTEDAEMVVFYFQGGGGGVQANIDRWIGQFTKADGSPADDAAKTSHKVSHGIPITVVDVSGTYVAGMGSMTTDSKGKPNFRMLGAVAESSSGPWFFKLTGPVKTVTKWEPSFESFLDTFQQ